MASRSKSARAARSDATARMVGIRAALADVLISTVESPSSVTAIEGPGSARCRLLPLVDRLPIRVTGGGRQSCSPRRAGSNGVADRRVQVGEQVEQLVRSGDLQRAPDGPGGDDQAQPRARVPRPAGRPGSARPARWRPGTRPRSGRSRTARAGPVSSSVTPGLQLGRGERVDLTAHAQHGHARGGAGDGRRRGRRRSRGAPPAATPTSWGRARRVTSGRIGQKSGRTGSVPASPGARSGSGGCGLNRCAEPYRRGTRTGGRGTTAAPASIARDGAP